MLCLLHGLSDTWSRLWLLRLIAFLCRLPSRSTVCALLARLLLPEILSLRRSPSQGGRKAPCHWILRWSATGISSRKFRWPSSRRRNQKVNLCVQVHIFVFCALEDFREWSYCKCAWLLRFRTASARVLQTKNPKRQNVRKDNCKKKTTTTEKKKVSDL